jgi:hypothetical protein
MERGTFVLLLDDGEHGAATWPSASLESVGRVSFRFSSAGLVGVDEAEVRSGDGREGRRGVVVGMAPGANCGSGCGIVAGRITGCMFYLD